MNKVTSVNLNGRAFQLEEQAYEALRAYLDDAARLLADDPDCAEIMLDLEQAIADKGTRYLGPGKNVLSGVEVRRILEEMGPVEPGEQDAGGGDKTADAAAAPPRRDPTPPPKRLYQLKEGAMIAGVCNGLAAYFGMDPTVMRLIFVVLLFLSSGFWLIAYLVLMFVLPTAKTSEERAAARGLPFNAQELVEQAKQHYSQIKEGHQRWRARRRAERDRKFWSARENRYEAHSGPFPEPQSGYGARIAAGIALPLLTILSAVFTVAWLIVMLSLLTTGEVLGWRPPLDVEPWTVLLALIAVYAIVALPARAIRYASMHALGGQRAWFVFWDGVLWFVLVLLAWWAAARFVPGVGEFFRDLFHNWRDLPFNMNLGLGRMFG